jgi:ribosomal protein S18 acetylase RimI-like enzyme
MSCVPSRRRSGGQGIGRLLARANFEFARRHDYQKLVVWVRGSNGTAQRLYKSLGFRERGHLLRQLLVGREFEDELLMELFF